MSRYRKSWSQVIEEVYLGEALKPKDKKVVDAFYDEKEDDQPKANLSSDGKTLWIAGSKAAQWKNGKIEILHAPSGRFDQSVFKYMRKSIPSLNFAKEEVELEESAALQLKMAFDDAGIKIKGTKGGKLVISKKDEKKVEKIIAKQMKKPSDAKRVLGSQIVFEEVELAEKSKKHPDLAKIEKEIDKFHNQTKHHKYLSGKDSEKMTKLSKKRDAILTKLHPNQSPTWNEEVELDEGTAYPPTIKNLKMIVKDKQNQVFMFPSGKARVDLFTASAMVQVYDALKPATKKKFEDMIKSKEGFMKSQAFAMKMAK